MKQFYLVFVSVALLGYLVMGAPQESQPAQPSAPAPAPTPAGPGFPVPPFINNFITTVQSGINSLNTNTQNILTQTTQSAANGWASLVNNILPGLSFGNSNNNNQASHDVPVAAVAPVVVAPAIAAPAVAAPAAPITHEIVNEVRDADSANKIDKESS